MTPAPPFDDNEIPKKEIKIRLDWNEYEQIKKIIKNKHFKHITDFSRQALEEMLRRQKDKLRKRIKGKRGISGE